MKLRKPLLILCLALLPWPVAAADKTQTYVIKKGDTLWGISERFLKDPYYWPNLWSHNPEVVTNPHLIYPGQTVRIIGGRLEIVPVHPGTETVAVEGPAAAEPVAESSAEAKPEKTPAVVQEAITLRAGRAGGFVSSAELAAAGVLVDTVDNRLMMAAGDTVFVEMRDLAAVRPGDTFSLFEAGKGVTHPVTGAPLGNRIEELGTVRIVAKNASVATALVTDSFREIRRGARLLPFRKAPKEIALKRAQRPLSGHLIAGGDDKLALGQYDIIHVDLGTRDGLEPGNLLQITRSRTASEFGLQAETVTLPDILLGSAVVLETQPRTASALVLKVAQPIFLGDRVQTQTE